MNSIVEKLELYNPDVKLRYLEQFEMSSALTIGYVLAKATSAERALNKDLAKFTIDEIDLVLFNINPVNLSSSKRYGGILRNYINWAMANGFGTGSSINVLEGLGDMYYKKFVGQKRMNISKDELFNSILSNLVNEQDKLPLHLAFEGIAGEDLYEQRHLTLDCIKDDTTLVLPQEDGTMRTINVTPELIEQIRRAERENVYLFKNGLSEGRAKESRLVESDYVIRKPYREKVDAGNENVPVEKFVLYNRLRKIGHEYSDYPQLTYKNLQQSGMIYMAYQIFTENGELTDADYNNIAERFNFKKVIGKGTDKAYYSIGTVSYTHLTLPTMAVV